MILDPKSPPKNPLRAWWLTTKADFTQTKMAALLGIGQSYLGNLLQDNNHRMPSLLVMANIEVVTQGAVTNSMFTRFVLSNRQEQQERSNSAGPAPA